MDTRLLDDSTMQNQGPPSEQRDVVDELRGSKNIDEIMAVADSRDNASSAVGSPKDEGQNFHASTGPTTPCAARKSSEHVQRVQANTLQDPTSDASWEQN